MTAIMKLLVVLGIFSGGAAPNQEGTHTQGVALTGFESDMELVQVPATEGVQSEDAICVE